MGAVFVEVFLSHGVEAELLVEGLDAHLCGEGDAPRAALPELAALAEGDWEGAVITQPIPVSRMHALMAQALEQDGESFFAALQ